MDTAVEALLEVQDKDIRVFNLRKQIDSVPQEKEKISLLLHDAEEAAQQSKDAVLDAENRLKNVEIEISTINDKVRSLQSKSTEIKKNDEYKAFLKEIESFQKEVSKFEDQQLQLWEELELAKKERAKDNKNLEAAKARISAAIDDLEIRNRNCKEQIEKVTSERTRLVETVPEELFRLYERLLNRPSSKRMFTKILVPMELENCGSCYLKVTPQVKRLVKNGQTVACENCGALLYYGP